MDFFILFPTKKRNFEFKNLKKKTFFLFKKSKKKFSRPPKNWMSLNFLFLKNHKKIDFGMFFLQKINKFWIQEIGKNVLIFFKKFFFSSATFNFLENQSKSGLFYVFVFQKTKFQMKKWKRRFPQIILFFLFGLVLNFWKNQRKNGFFHIFCSKKQFWMEKTKTEVSANYCFLQSYWIFFEN